MKKIGIVMDVYKLPFFEKRLTEAGFKFSLVTDGTTPVREAVKAGGMHTLIVECEEADIFKLADLVKKVNDEARQTTGK